MSVPSAPKGSTLGALFASLRKLGVEYAGSISGGTGGQFYCPNPDHDDDHPSFDVHLGSKGGAVFTCTPCREAMGQEDFVALLRSHGVKWRGEPIEDPAEIDWGPAAPSSGGSGSGPKAKGALELTAVYTYNHEDGSPNFCVRRFDPAEGSEARKEFRPQRYERGTGWVGGRGALDNVERTPYLLERFDGWAGKPIYLVEGEKCVEALVEAGKAATTFHGGTAAKIEENWPTLFEFTRFAEVRLWPDADELGVERMERYAADLADAGVRFSFWGVPAAEIGPKEDAADVLPRKQKPRRLTDEDLAALKALRPKPQPKTRARVAPVEPVKVGGKVIVSADGYEAAGGDPREPFGCSAVQAPYDFTAEMIERFYRQGEVHTLRFRHDDRSFWMWNERKGRYDFLTGDDIVAQVKKRLSESVETFQPADGPAETRPVKVTNRLTGEIVGHLESLTLTSEYGGGELLPSVGGVPFRNGWLDAETGELLPIGPERDIRWNVTTAYDPDATCYEWERFLASLGWTPDTEEYRLLRMWLGYLLSGRKDQEKGLLMLGPTRSGKGTILFVAHALLGDGAVGTTLDSLTRNFGLQAMIGKGLATIGDARFGRNDKALNGILLSLTSNDPLPVDVKYGKPLSIVLPVRLMIATNETPNFIEASDALAERFIVLKFTESFLGREDRGLRRRLLPELAGIARWALGGLRDLDEMGRFAETKAGRAIQKQMIQESAFVRLFVEECCEIGPGFKVSNERLYAEFRRWAEDNGMPVYNIVKFSRELLDAFPSQIENGNLKDAGRSVRGKIGVRLS